MARLLVSELTYPNPIGWSSIGIFGGTFDPIHFGHLRMAQELGESLNLDEIRFIPAARPPHRAEPHVAAQQRAEMVGLAIAGNPLFKLDTREFERAGPSYMVDTLSSLRAELGKDAPLCLLLGGDAFLGLPTWHRWQELPGLAHIVVAHRPGAVPIEAAMPDVLLALWRQHATEKPSELAASPAGRILLHPITALDISASAIREQLQQMQSPRYLLPDVVLAYIQTHHLYQKEPHGT